MDANRLADPLDLCGPEWPQSEIALDQLTRAVTDDCGAGIGKALQPGRQIYGVSDRRVFSMHRAGFNCSHHHLAGIGYPPELNRGADLASHTCAGVARVA